MTMFPPQDQLTLGVRGPLVGNNLRRAKVDIPQMLSILQNLLLEFPSFWMKSEISINFR